MPAPVLVVGLGNPLAGDDGVGWHVVEELDRHHELPDGVELARGGTDLLALQSRLEGRQHVVLVDALLGTSVTGTVWVTDDVSELDDRQGGAHQLSAVQALALLRAVVPAVEESRFTWFTICVGGVRQEAELSPELRAALPRLARQVLDTALPLAHPLP